MGQEDALRGRVYWLVEPFDGNRLPRLVQSTHLLGAEVLANAHRLSLAALVTPVACSSSIRLKQVFPLAMWSISTGTSHFTPGCVRLPPYFVG